MVIVYDEENTFAAAFAFNSHVYAYFNYNYNTYNNYTSYDTKQNIEQQQRVFATRFWSFFSVLR